MLSHCPPWRPGHLRRAAALTLVFGAVLATGAATGSFKDLGGQRRTPADARVPAGTVADTAAIAEAIAAGKVGPQAAEDLVSRSGDRWSSFYTAQEYEGFQQSLDGRYVGVGLGVRRTEDGRIAIARVQSGSPAARAGVHAADRLTSIDGIEVTGRPVTEVVARLRGADAAGTPVALGLRRGSRSWEVSPRRALLPTESVRVRHDPGGVTVVTVDAFTKGVAGQVRRALSGRPGHAGVLLDLRGNSGGLVTEAVGVASALLDGGLVATYDVHGRQRALYAADGGDTDTPLVVLVDGGTMSAAELLAGALQDRGRAVVVGSRTFGKGSVQMPSRLPDGSVAELTVGHYRLPAGRRVDGRGIEPDLSVTGGADVEAQALQVLDGLGAPAR
ncbi:S41 family peptidase [Streptomyces sp. ME01-24h]|nr:S41 family peptidase [Streptomyces sp. ME19-03-3]MDX3355388.1 S41 family peptidase [Streptomyces sp. ME01-24h]